MRWQDITSYVYQLDDMFALATIGMLVCVHYMQCFLLVGCVPGDFSHLSR